MSVPCQRISKSSRANVMVFGMMTRMPVGGVVWQTVHYLTGLKLLGCRVTYVEAHAVYPAMFADTTAAIAFLRNIMRRFSFEDDWAFHALHEDGLVYGLPFAEVVQRCREADAVINLHGGTLLPDHCNHGRIVFLETDPVAVQVDLYHNDPAATEFLARHDAFFTFGENYGQPDCKLPVSDRFDFRPTRQPVVMDFWECAEPPSTDLFTTIGNWKQEQLHRAVELEGSVYTWSKHHEFLRFIDLPSKTTQPFELALSKCEKTDRLLLESHGWRVRNALTFSRDIDAYRRYVTDSRGEFTVAKDQNIRLQSGWFSDRSATYLAAGRPVINQDTGFRNILPTGEGLFSFTTEDDILAAIESIASDYDRHSRAAREIAREYFSYDRVLELLLHELGL